MPISVVWRESGALRRRLGEIASAVDPRSSRMDRFRYKLTKIAKQDNEDKLYRGAGVMVGVDRYGKKLDDPAESTIKSWDRRGLIRQILAPHGLASRVITQFRVVWQWTGSQYEMIAGWKDLPWIVYHLRGCRKGSHPLYPKWSLPKRDIGGISPKGWVQVRAEFTRFAKLLAKK